MCLLIEVGTVEHIQVEVSSACLIIRSRCVLLNKKNESTEFLFHLIPGECTVKKKIKLRNLFTAQLCISQLKP